MSEYLLPDHENYLDSFNPQTLSREVDEGLDSHPWIHLLDKTTWSDISSVKNEVLKILSIYSPENFVKPPLIKDVICGVIASRLRPTEIAAMAPFINLNDIIDAQASSTLDLAHDSFELCEDGDGRLRQSIHAGSFLTWGNGMIIKAYGTLTGYAHKPVLTANGLILPGHFYGVRTAEKRQDIDNFFKDEARTEWDISSISPTMSWQYQRPFITRTGDECDVLSTLIAEHLSKIPPTEFPDVMGSLTRAEYRDWTDLD